MTEGFWDTKGDCVASSSYRYTCYLFALTAQLLAQTKVRGLNLNDNESQNCVSDLIWLL